MESTVFIVGEVKRDEAYFGSHLSTYDLFNFSNGHKQTLVSGGSRIFSPVTLTANAIGGDIARVSWKIAKGRERGNGAARGGGLSLLNLFLFLPSSDTMFRCTHSRRTCTHTRGPRLARGEREANERGNAEI